MYVLGSEAVRPRFRAAFLNVTRQHKKKGNKCVRCCVSIVNLSVSTHTCAISIAYVVYASRSSRLGVWFHAHFPRRQGRSVSDKRLHLQKSEAETRRHTSSDATAAESKSSGVVLLKLLAEAKL